MWGVRWGFDGTTVGSATFYDTLSSHFVHQLLPGPHTFWVSSSCGQEVVTFNVAP
jgi:hypothetical protein